MRKWIGYTLLGLLLLALSVYVYAYWKTEKKWNKVYTTQLLPITIPSDSLSIIRGAHQYVVHACRDCHGADLKGKLMFDDFMLGKVWARNLTKGKGGLPADFSDEDWLRALKHGINREGKPLVIMPANESSLIADEDLADIIAYCKSRPPVNSEPVKKQKLGFFLRILVALDKANLFPAEQIDHSAKSIAAKTPEVTASYGQYLSTNCAACHRADFQGGPPLAPGYPPVPNITSTGSVGQWSEEEFMQTLRTGITPQGHQLDSTKMPWPRTREFSDTELKAVRLFLTSLPK